MTAVRERTERRRERPPLPPERDGLPLVGSTLDVMRRPIAFLDDLAAYGDVVTYRVAGQRFVAVFDPDAIEQVLVEDHDRFRRWSGEEWGDTFAGYASEGLLLSEGEQWRRQRLLLQGVFAPTRIASYADAMIAETERAIDEWTDDGAIELADAASRLTLRRHAAAGRTDPRRRPSTVANRTRSSGRSPRRESRTDGWGRSGTEAKIRTVRNGRSPVIALPCDQRHLNHERGSAGMGRRLETRDSEAGHGTRIQR